MNRVSVVSLVLFLAILLNPRAHADDWWKKAIKIVVNPIGSAHEEVAKALAPAVKANPETTGKIVNPANAAIDAAIKDPVGAAKIVTNPAGAAHEAAAKLTASRIGVNPDLAGAIANPLGTGMEVTAKDPVGAAKIILHPAGSAHEFVAKTAAKQVGVNAETTGMIANPIGAAIEIAARNPATAVKVLSDPAGMAHELVAREVAPIVGVNPEVAGQLVNPVGNNVLRAPAFMESLVKIESDHIVDMYNAVKEGRIDKVFIANLQHQFSSLMNPELLKAAAPLVMMATIVPGTRDFYMTPPEFIEIDPNGYGRGVAPVIYVNGMYRDEDAAIAEGAALSRHLGRPVWLLYNPTNGFTSDLGESILDRFVPWLPVPGKPQLNKTTRQLIHYLYHTSNKVSIVSHSQGCIIVRNALMTAHYFKPVRHNVAWVATGMPLKREEIYPEPIKFRALSNPGDIFVAQLSALKLDPDMFTKVEPIKAHEFIDSYLRKISNNDLFIGNERPNVTKEQTERTIEGVWMSEAGLTSVTFRNDEITVTNANGKSYPAYLGETGLVNVPAQKVQGAYFAPGQALMWIPLDRERAQGDWVLTPKLAEIRRENGR